MSEGATACNSCCGFSFEDMVHRVYRTLAWNIGWKSPSEDCLFEYFYAEDRLYVVRKKHTGLYRFVIADSPKDALESCAEEVEEVWIG